MVRYGASSTLGLQEGEARWLNGFDFPLAGCSNTPFALLCFG